VRVHYVYTPQGKFQQQRLGGDNDDNVQHKHNGKVMFAGKGRGGRGRKGGSRKKRRQT
jgi:hypothetical protein